MKPEEITALAREYAEEYTKKKYPNAPGHVRERIVEGRLEHMEDFIPWLLQRYCLVEKEYVNEAYKGAIETSRLGEETGAYSLCTFGSARRILLESLFPDLGKEVLG